ncbi:Uncharacterised protein [Mycobacterium tuberculosis]|nr:Uncharacterised protein [Mycobacterium tuberculosis]CKR53861.1 Uncharacterised protein [Mycobacterium tuberculosis]CNV01234.1 Uncharacterised protein [Mycobacterium tuberculosis]CNV75668.1 Uncharacterised protein [Mycobacterium tuberculosis]CNW48120.1 Uncharacterised protein [Mycobacterium tuberculosis]
MQLGQLDGFLAVAGLADNFISLLSQHLGQVHADERFIFRDQDPTWDSGIGVGGGAGHDGHCVVSGRDREPRGAVSRDVAPLE